MLFNKWIYVCLFFVCFFCLFVFFVLLFFCLFVFVLVASSCFSWIIIIRFAEYHINKKAFLFNLRKRVSGNTITTVVPEVSTIAENWQFNFLATHRLSVFVTPSIGSGLVPYIFFLYRFLHSFHILACRFRANHLNFFFFFWVNMLSAVAFYL